MSIFNSYYMFDLCTIAFELKQEKSSTLDNNLSYGQYIRRV